MCRTNTSTHHNIRLSVHHFRRNMSSSSTNNNAIQRKAIAHCYVSIRHVFEACGLAPHGRLLVAWSGLQIVAIIASLVALFAFGETVIERFDDADQVQAIFKGGTLILAHVSILAEALQARPELCQVYVRHSALDAVALANNDSRSYIESAQRRFVLIFVGYIVLVAVAETIISGTVRIEPEWQLYWLATLVSLTVCRMRHLQHAMYVLLLTARVRGVRKRLHRLAENTRTTTPEDEVEQQLKLLQTMAADVYAVSVHMERIFAVSQLLNLMQNFVQLSCDLYALYSLLHSNRLSEAKGTNTFSQ